MNRGQPPKRDAHAGVISTGDVFRQLILDEVRTGRLTPARRRRIVAYAARLGLSAVEAGELLEDCRRQLEREDHPAADMPALKLAEPAPPETRQTPILFAAVIIAAAAVTLDVLVALVTKLL